MTARKPRSAQRTRLANALAAVKRLQAENDLRAEMLQTAQDMIALHESKFKRVALVMRAAADQLDVRDAVDTAAHLRAEADMIDRRADAKGAAALSPGMRNAMHELAGRGEIDGDQALREAGRK